MTVDLSHLLPHYRTIAQLDADERTDWIIQDRWIGYSRVDRILTRLSSLLDYPARDRMPAVLVTGAPGMGKTKLARKFDRDHQRSHDERTGISHVPVVIMQMPPEPNEKDFYEEFLTALGAPVPFGISASALRHRVRMFTRQLDVRLLLIDEVHALLAGTFRQQRIMLNAIRFLATDLRLPLVCLGTAEAKQALMTDQQLADRFEAYELPAWSDDDEFANLMESYLSFLPLRKASALRDSKVKRRILGLTDGVLVRICRIVEAAAIAVIENGKERIELEDLSEEIATRSLVSVSERRRRRAGT